ncbi:MAG: DUF92 domain-containing protein [Pleomorphochaeta sp.]
MSDRFLQSSDPSSLAAVIDRFFLSINNYVIWIILLLLILAVVAYLTKQLTIGGVFGAFSLGVVIILSFGFGGLTILLFFVIGAGILSKINKHNKIYEEAQEIQEKNGSRDIIQVFANGGVSFFLGLIYLISPSPLILIMFGASVAEALSDTFAGEVGMLTKGKTVSILTGKPVKPGLSGGVSIEGTLASLIGSFLIATMWYSTYFNPSIRTVSFVAIVTLAGFLGALIDSVLGITIQAHYYDEDKDKIVEKEFVNGKKLPLVKGLRIINNDKVNFISNLFSVVFVALFYKILV